MGLVVGCGDLVNFKILEIGEVFRLEVFWVFKLLCGIKLFRRFI